MTLQDRFPYDPTFLGLEGLYEPLGDGSFLVESKNIMVSDQIISTGDTYFLVERDRNKKVGVTFVKLLDAFFYQDMVYLLVVETISGVVRLLNHALENNGFVTCKWRLVDTFSVEMMMDRKYGRNSGTQASNQIHFI